MTVRIGINGLGRIGRSMLKIFMADDDMEVAAVNDIAPLDNLVYLLKHDSVYTAPFAEIEQKRDLLIWNNEEIRYSNHKDPAGLPWDELDVDIAIEATGKFTREEDAGKHLDAGAGRVIISAAAKGHVESICMGVNEEDFDSEKHYIVSNVSCTTNCLAPVASVLDDEFGIENGFLTTVHAVTRSQTTVDAPAKKWRRGRSALANIVPTTTGATTATVEVLPRLKGKLDGMAMRVPLAVGSIVDFVAQTEKKVTLDSLNGVFEKASESKKLKGILGYSEEELVSSDIIGTTYSALIDGKSNLVLGDNLCKVLAWYDNEWGYAARMVDLARYISEKIK